jgi:amino acid transporter
MASTGVDLPGKQPHSHPVAGLRINEEKDTEKLAEAVPVETVSIDEGDHTHRKLKSRHIQLIGKFKHYRTHGKPV